MMIKLYGFQEKRCRENNKSGMITSGLSFEQCNQKNMLGNTRASARNAW